MNKEIIIVGAGAAGLMAAKELSAKGFNVTVLEADERFGGRIHTILDSSFDIALEAGAEFIHGNLHETIQLLNEAKIIFTPVKSKTYQVKQGMWKHTREFIQGWDEVMKKIQEVESDMTVSDFLNRYFSGDKYFELRERIRRFTEGFDAADIHTASIIALREEWMQDDEEQYRVEGGYYQLAEYLVMQCKKNNCGILLSQAVKKIEWNEHNVKVYTQNGKIFSAGKIIITIPVSILQNNTVAAAIQFLPNIPEYINAVKKMGYGNVIKIFLQVKRSLWKDKLRQKEFIISDQVIPTWWTQSSDKSTLLTGWLAGPNAKALRNADPAIIYTLMIESLASIFSMEPGILKNEIIAWKIVDWLENDYSLGAYSFETIESRAAKEILNKPIQNTLYFTGEALYNGPHPGTVEAALVSGKNIAALISAV